MVLFTKYQRVLFTKYQILLFTKYLIVLFTMYQIILSTKYLKYLVVLFTKYLIILFKQFVLFWCSNVTTSFTSFVIAISFPLFSTASHLCKHLNMMSYLSTYCCPMTVLWHITVVYLSHDSVMTYNSCIYLSQEGMALMKDYNF